MAYIYKITNTINGKMYIGKTESTIEKRFRQHCKDSQRDKMNNRPLYKAAAEYMVQNKLTGCKKTTIKQHITEVCTGRRKTAAKFKWKYAE